MQKLSSNIIIAPLTVKAFMIIIRQQTERERTIKLSILILLHLERPNELGELHIIIVILGHAISNRFFCGDLSIVICANINTSIWAQGSPIGVTLKLVSFYSIYLFWHQ